MSRQEGLSRIVECYVVKSKIGPRNPIKFNRDLRFVSFFVSDVSSPADGVFLQRQNFDSAMRTPGDVYQAIDHFVASSPLKR